MFDVASRGCVGGFSGVWDKKGAREVEMLSARARVWKCQGVSCLEGDDEEEEDIHCIRVDPCRGD